MNPPIVKKTGLLVLLMLLAFAAWNQFPSAWVARFAGPAHYNDLAADIAVDASGNVYVTGQSWEYATPGDPNTLNSDYLTLKYDADGTKLWEARYRGPGNVQDYPSAIAVDASGNVYVTGSSSTLTKGEDYITVKYNAGGVQQWEARYDSLSTDQAVALAVDASGNVYVSGYSQGPGFVEGFPTLRYDYLTLKYDTDGNRLWVRRYNGPGAEEDVVRALALDDWGNVYVTGESYGGLAVNTDFATIKYDTDGNQLWVARYNNSAVNGFDGALALAVDGSGYAYVTGVSYGGSATNIDYATVKYGANGVQQWVARYDGRAHFGEEARAIGVDAAGNVYVTGSSVVGDDVDSDEIDFATVKYNAAGVQQWAKRYNGPAGGMDRAVALALDGAGNVYVTGKSSSTAGEGPADFATVRYSPKGGEQWVARYNGPNNDTDEPIAMAVDGPGNVYVTGMSTVAGSDMDYATLKYGALKACWKDKVLVCHQGKTVCTAISSLMSHIGHGDKPGACGGGTPCGMGPIADEDNESDSRFTLEHVPNPVADRVRIRYELPFGGQVTLKLYDELGREVRTLKNGHLEAGVYSTDADATRLRKGVYYYRITLQAGIKILSRTGQMTVVR
ncbi:SBBP repeat-containing protein [Paraflavisolibacter sp. H34]|uniref:SBBP repeat-containing protein n=1 Tax=Huijunlia imazamoxiresistens TaxID=3127457 RepID=UPI003018E3CB